MESFSNLFLYMGIFFPQHTATPDMLNCLSGPKWVAPFTLLGS